jgi:hypothetical protein
MNVLSVKGGIVAVELGPQECTDLANVIEHGLAETLDPTYHYAETVRAAFTAIANYQCDSLPNQAASIAIG